MENFILCAECHVSKSFVSYYEMQIKAFEYFRIPK